MSINNAMQNAAKQLGWHSRQLEYRTNPALWIKDVMGKELWSRQGEIAQSVVDNKRTAVKSSNSVGKSYLAAMLACWWVSVYPENQTLVITTASTGPQVHKVLWRYVRQFHSDYNLKGYVTMASEWRTDDGTLLGFGRKPDGDDVTGFQGYHADYILVLADEAGNIPEPLFAGFEAVTVNDTSRIVAIGNPDVHGSYFHSIFKKPEDQSVWKRMTISSFDTPAFTGEKVPQTILDNLASKQWVADRAKEWGVDSPRYQAKVLGEFADQSEATLFSQTTINAGIDCELDPDVHVPIHLGVDVARFGTDFSTVYSYQGGKVRKVAHWSFCDTVESANRIIHWAFELKATEVRIDGVGIGAGVLDMVTHRSEGRFETIGIVGNAMSPDLDKWLNARAFYYDDMRQRMKNGELDIDPEDTALQDELGIIEYKFSKSRGALQIESKDDMRKRGVKSPDFADGAMYACADLGIDPTDPIHKLVQGSTFETLPDEWLFAHEREISPY
jgi:hypothetical protein